MNFTIRIPAQNISGIKRIETIKKEEIYYYNLSL